MCLCVRLSLFGGFVLVVRVCVNKGKQGRGCVRVGCGASTNTTSPEYETKIECDPSARVRPCGRHARLGRNTNGLGLELTRARVIPGRVCGAACAERSI